MKGAMTMMPSTRKYPIHRQKDDTRDYIKRYNLAPKMKLVTNVDIRALMPPVFDQGELGSCTANAGVADLMVVLAKKQGLQITQMEMLSRIFQYYNERVIENTVPNDNGAEMRDIGKAMTKYGVCIEDLCKYVIADFTKTPSDAAYQDALKYKPATYSSLPDLTAVKTYVAVHQMPVLMGMDVYPGFESDATAQSGIVPMPKKGEQCLGGHAVLIVGYKKIGCKKYLIVRNSWGAGWGDHGYFYLPETYITAGYAYDFWVVE